MFFSIALFRPGKKGSIVRFASQKRWFTAKWGRTTIKTAAMHLGIAFASCRAAKKCGDESARRCYCLKRYFGKVNDKAFQWRLTYWVILPLFVLFVVSWDQGWFVTLRYKPQRQFSSKIWLSTYPGRTDSRQKMIRDLTQQFLPGKTQQEILSALGPSPTHEEMRRYTLQDVRTHRGGTNSYTRSGVGWFYDGYEWDLIYEIGKEKIFIWDRAGQEFSPDQEYLVIRLDTNNTFESFFIIGSHSWSRILGEESVATFRERR